MVCWDSKVHNFASSLFLLLLIITSGLLAQIRWSVYLSKSYRSLCVSLSRTDLGFCIYHLFVWWNLNFLHKSQGIHWKLCKKFKFDHIIIIIIIIIILHFKSFSYQCQLMVFHWSLCDNNSPQVSRTLLSMLADLNNTVVRMLSSSLLISESSTPCPNSLVTVPSAPVIIIIVI